MLSAVGPAERTAEAGVVYRIEADPFAKFPHAWHKRRVSVRGLASRVVEHEVAIGGACDRAARSKLIDYLQGVLPRRGFELHAGLDLRAWDHDNKTSGRALM